MRAKKRREEKKQKEENNSRLTHSMQYMPVNECACVRQRETVRKNCDESLHRIEKNGFIVHNFMMSRLFIDMMKIRTKH